MSCAGFTPGAASISCGSARRWTFRTADDLAWLLGREQDEKRKLSRAAIETLAIVAYHQPVTRAEIEEIRGVAVSKGALDVLMEARLGADARAAQGAGSADHLRHDERIPDPFRARRDRRPAGPRRAEGRRLVRRQAAGRLRRFRNPTTTPRCGPTRIRSMSPRRLNKPGRQSPRTRAERVDHGH